MDLNGLQQTLTPLERSGDWEALSSRAAQFLSEVPAGSMEEAYLRYLLGKAQVQRGQHELAEPQLRRSLQLQPHFSYSHHLLGRCQMAAGRWRAGHRSQQKCCDLNPDFAYGWFHRARAAIALGSAEEALACFQRAASLAPEHDWIRHEMLRTEVLHLLAIDGPERAAETISAAIQRFTLPETLLREWLTLAHEYALCGFLEEALLLSNRLAADTDPPSPTADSIPRRPALLLTAILVLIRSLTDPVATSPGEQEFLAGQLRECCWRTVQAGEKDLWSAWIEPMLQMLMVRLLRQDSVPAASPLAEGILAVAGALGSAQLHPATGPMPRALPDQRLFATSSKASGLFRDLAEALGLPPLSDAGEIPAGPDVCSMDLRLCLEDLPALLQASAAEMKARPGRHRPLRQLDRRLLHLCRQALGRTASLAEREGTVARALALREQCLDSLAQAAGAMATLDGAMPLPTTIRRQRWLLVASPNLPQCFLYRVRQKIEALQHAGCRVHLLMESELAGWGCTAELLLTDAVMICRLPATYPLLRFLGRARRAGISIYYDIDDLIFDSRNFPPPLDHYGGTISPQIHRGLALDCPLFRVAMEQADTILVSTRTLARRWVELSRRPGQPVLVLPNMAPAALLRFSPRPLAGRESIQHIVFSSGTLAHKQVWFEEVAPALVNILRSYSLVQLSLLGSIELPDDLLVFRDRIRQVSYTTYEDYLMELGQCDVGLAPLEPGIVTDSKSAIKWMEYSFLGLASIVSPTATYREILTDGEDVLFARGSQQWERAMRSLIEQPDRCNVIAGHAQVLARRLFGPTMTSHWWQSFLAPKSGGGPSISRETAPERLLVINVFFSPQSIGGATAVAEAQVEEVLSHAGDRYQVTVLCVDDDPWQGEVQASSIPIDIHQWRGARVVRLGLPPSDWSQHHNGLVEEFCRHWFREEKFSLIHAHCLQMLTAAPLKVALDLGIPYLISLHDAWWLSPLQFLVREDGHPVNPADPLGHLMPEEQDRENGLLAHQARRRHRDLHGILAGARARMAVSRSFAALYRACGVQDVDVLENPWSPMETAERRSAASDAPLRICHVGGMALHKGYGILRAAVHSVELSNVALTVIDHSLPQDEQYRSLWRGTPVLFRPRVAMDDMARFYASQDVLVAPSIWPESYGLVTREALSAGLWVVASDIGALAEPIEEGVNGNRIPPGDWRILGETLMALARNRPAVPIPESSKPRPVRGGEVVTFYDLALAHRSGSAEAEN